MENKKQNSGAPIGHHFTEIKDINILFEKSRLNKCQFTFSEFFDCGTMHLCKVDIPFNLNRSDIFYIQSEDIEHVFISVRTFMIRPSDMAEITRYEMRNERKFMLPNLQCILATIAIDITNESDNEDLNSRLRLFITDSCTFDYNDFLLVNVPLTKVLQGVDKYIESGYMDSEITSLMCDSIDGEHDIMMNITFDKADFSSRIKEGIFENLKQEQKQKLLFNPWRRK